MKSIKSNESGQGGAYRCNVCDHIKGNVFEFHQNFVKFLKTQHFSYGNKVKTFTSFIVRKISPPAAQKRKNLDVFSKISAVKCL